LAFSQTDPNAIYLGAQSGYVHGSMDKGLTWNEARLVTLRTKFFGAIRPARTSSGAGFAMNFDGISTNLRSGFSFRDSETGRDYLDINQNNALDPGGGLRGFEEAGAWRYMDSGGGGGGGGDSARFGVGIQRAAPRLQALLKRRRARLIGLNLKLLLNVKGVEPAFVNHIAVHPDDARHALAATAMGLFETRDGGMGWDHIFSGRNHKERWCNFVEFDPRNPDRLYLATNQGLLISIDGGEKFAQVTGSQLSSASTRWIEQHPEKKNIIYAGTSNLGVFRSDDGGSNWRWIFFETLPAANNIRNIALDPKDPERVTIATMDGAFRSKNGGDSWERSGGFLFTSQKVRRVRTNPKNGNHLVALTELKVWESFDWGDTWEALYVNDSDWSTRGLAFDPHEDGVFWVVTSAELLRISSTPPEEPDPVRLRELQARLSQEPNLSEVMDAAFRTIGVHRGVLGNKRQLARKMGLVPTLNVVGGYAQSDIATALGAGFLDLYGSSSLGQYGARDVNDSISAGRNSITNQTLLFNKNQEWKFPYVGVILNWDFSQLVFHREEPPYGRYFYTANEGYLTIKYRVQQLYEERRRVLVLLATVPPNEAKSRFNLRLRLEELTAYLDYLTGGLYTQQIEQLEAEGWLPQSLMNQLIRQSGNAPPSVSPNQDKPGFMPSREVTF
jgi:photosystem II stability/assembly factor-like uncharacterized protein